MRDRFFARVLCACFALCLGACSLLAPRPSSFAREPLRIAPAVLGEHTVEQRLVIRWKGGGRAMDAVLETGEGRLQLVLLAFGMRLMGLEYDGDTLSETRAVPHAPEGVRMLNDFLMIAAPLEELRRALPPGAGVSETRLDGHLRRELALEGVTKIVIDFEGESPWQGKVLFRNLEQGYELSLESHEI